MDSKSRIVVAALDQSAGQFVVARYLSSGKVDGSFGTGGLSQETSFGGFAPPNGVVIDSNGKIVVAGGSNNDFAAVRFLSS